MKKKLVAFAVTAAMVITSAVPALAWSDDVTKVDYTKNQIVVDKTVNSGGGIVETAVAGGIADSKTFTTTVDLNRIAGQFEYVLGLSTDGKDQKMVKLYVGAGKTAGTAVMNLFAADDPYVDADQITVRGIVDITWTFHQNDEGTWVSVAVQERGKTAAQGGYEFEYKLPETINTVDWLKLNGWDERDATKDTASVADGAQIVIYQDAATAPKEVASVEVVKANADGTPIVQYGKHVVATQPVAGETYYINSITLDDGTVVTGEDVTKYVTFEWTAVKANGTTVPTAAVPLKDLPKTDDNRTARRFTVKDDGRFDGCFISAVVTAVKDAGIFGDATWGDDADALAVQQRLAGENRYETAIKVADQMKTSAGFANFFVATGDEYADALSAAALAEDMKAPILLVNDEYEATVAKYIEDNAASYKTTTVYVLGGTNAVSADFEEMLYKFDVDVVRLDGDTRYDTNIKVLEEYFKLNPINKIKNCEILVASGQNYPDALSASATGMPILLVGDELTSAQKDYLQTLAPVNSKTDVVTYHVDEFTIIGGTSAVNADVKAELSRPAYIKSASNVTRLWGDDRYETNKAVIDNLMAANKATAKYAFVAYGMGYADALTGGVLAAKTGCPIVLVDDNHTGIASYVISTISDNDNYGGLVVIGGEAVISNELVQKIA